MDALSVWAAEAIAATALSSGSKPALVRTVTVCCKRVAARMGTVAFPHFDDCS